MSELKKDDVGTTGDGLGEGASSEASGKRARASAEGSSEDTETAESKGTIGRGEADASLTQASGGSVD
jgi:hypothetical protein